MWTNSVSVYAPLGYKRQGHVLCDTHPRIAVDTDLRYYYVFESVCFVESSYMNIPIN